MNSSTNFFRMFIDWVKEIFGRNPVDLLEGISSENANKLSYNISDEYVGFPKYNGKLKEWPQYVDTTKTYRGKNYKRVSMYFDYDEYKKEEYCNQLINEGFVKGSDVRYDKFIEGNNSYVIVEKINNREMKIAFHISMD